MDVVDELSDHQDDIIMIIARVVCNYGKECGSW